MIKQLSKLGTVLNRKEQKNIKGSAAVIESPDIDVWYVKCYSKICRKNIGAKTVMCINGKCVYSNFY